MFGFFEGLYIFVGVVSFVVGVDLVEGFFGIGGVVFEVVLYWVFGNEGKIGEEYKWENDEVIYGDFVGEGVGDVFGILGNGRGDKLGDRLEDFKVVSVSFVIM